jgi:peptide/nickel transport system permease protein
MTEGTSETGRMGEGAVPGPAAESRRRVRSRTLRHFLKKPLAIAGAVVLAVLLLASFLAPVIAPQNPYDLSILDMAQSLKPPVWMEGGTMPFILGTDIQGRDILSTILYGSRTSFVVGFSVVILASVIGTTIGLLSGFYGGIIDTVSMRFADSLLAFSTTLIAMLFLGLFKASSVLLVIVAITIVDWVQYARTIRGSVLSVKQEDYVLAARSVGAGNRRIIFRHILPNALSPLLVIAAVNFAVVVMLEATLSFLGVGVPITEPSLGMLIAQGKDFIYAGMWYLVVFPGFVLMAIVFSLNVIADWLRDEIDPRVMKG